MRAAGIALTGVALILVAFAFDTSALFVPGVAFLALGVVIPPWIGLAARGSSVTRSVEAERVVEDQPLEARIVVRGGPLGVPGGEVHDPLLTGPIALSSPLAGRRRNRCADVRVVVRFSRRGRRVLAAPTLTLRDPLGLAGVVRPGRAASHTLLVLPRLERSRWGRDPQGEYLDQQAGSAALEALAAVEVDGLRPYRPGTPASRISWPALARGAGLLERRMRLERDSGPLVVLDVRGSGPVQRLDAAVRAAASLTFELAGKSGCELLLPGDRRPLQIEADLGAWPAAHVRLALLEPLPSRGPAGLPVRARSGVVFYVADHNDRLPAQVVRGGLQGAILVLPKDLAPPLRAASRFEVSGCVGYLLAAGGRHGSRERAA